MLQTVGNRPTTGAGVPVELRIAEPRRDGPPFGLDGLDLPEQPLQFLSHLVILGKHLVFACAADHIPMPAALFILVTCCDLSTPQPPLPRCSCCHGRYGRRRSPTVSSSSRSPADASDTSSSCTAASSGNSTASSWYRGTRR